MKNKVATYESLYFKFKDVEKAYIVNSPNDYGYIYRYQVILEEDIIKEYGKEYYYLYSGKPRKIIIDNKVKEEIKILRVDYGMDYEKSIKNTIIYNSFSMYAKRIKRKTVLNIGYLGNERWGIGFDEERNYNVVKDFPELKK